MALNVTLLGYGSIARSHAQAVRALQRPTPQPPTGPHGVMGRLPEPTAEFAREFGVPRATTDLDELLADPAMDAVIVCSPSEVHAGRRAGAARGQARAVRDPACALAREAIGWTSRRGRPPVDGLPHAALLPAADRGSADDRVGRTPPARDRLALHVRAARERQLDGRRRSWTDNLLWHHGCHAVDAALWLLGAAEVEVAAEVALPGGELGIPMDLSIVRCARRATSRDRRDVLPTPTSQSTTTWSSARRRRSVRRRPSFATARACWFRKPSRLGVDDPIARQDAGFFAAVRRGREPAVRRARCGRPWPRCRRRRSPSTRVGGRRAATRPTHASRSARR